MTETTPEYRVLTSLGLAILLVAVGAVAADASNDDSGGQRPDEAVAASQLAAHLVRAAGIPQGLLVHVGSGGGHLTAALGQAGDFIVQSVSFDAPRVSDARRYIQTQGLYGRVSVDRLSGERLPYVDNLANVVVVDDLAAAMDSGLTIEEVVRVVCPGGVALLGRPADAPAARLTEARLKAILGAAGIEKYDVLHDQGCWARVRKPWPEDPGPHAPPSRVQWLAGPIWSRGHFSTLNWRSAGGRVFYFFDEAPTQVEGPAQVMLIARDAFNGLMLWKRSMPGAWQYPALQRAVGRMLATDDTLYVILEENGPLVALDAATGETRRTYADQSPTILDRYRQALILAGGGPVRSLNPGTGELLWQSNASGAIDVGEDRVFCRTRKDMVCLDASTGAVVWQRELPDEVKEGNLRRHYEGILLLAESRGSGAGAVHVLSAADGRHLWSRQYNTPPKGYGRDPLAAGGLVWIHIREDREAGVGWLGLDLQTGAVKRRIDYPPELAGKVRQRCFPNRIVGRFFVTGKDPVYVDWQKGDIHVAKFARGTCRAGGGFHSDYGLVYTGPHQCHCFPMLRGFVALAPGDRTDGGDHGRTRLEKGPAFGKEITPSGQSEGADWPCYRHDPMRSGATDADLPAKLKVLWRRPVGGQASSPTIAHGRLYVASLDTHAVLAFDAARGEPLWTFTAGGPVDTPPTIYRGMCLFGSRDGWVYCLDAASGDLVWRFRAAPADRRIVVDGRLESAWPVYGAVLVQNDTVFFTAGRDARLDGGMTLFALAPRTGEVRWQKRLEGDLVSDVLVSDGAAVCLPTLRFDPATGEAAEVNPWRPTQLRAGRGGLLDGALAIREGSWSSPAGGGRLLILDGRDDPRMTNDAAWSSPKADGQVQVFSARRAYAIATDVRNDGYVKQGQGAWTLSARESRKGDPVWSITVPIRPRAMLLARNVVLLAGTPDVLDPENPWAAIRGKRGAAMWTISTADGGKLAETTFDVPPLWDGLAAAGGRLYATLADGTILCLGNP